MVISKTPNWQMSLVNPLDTVQDAQDISQCVYVILTTMLGSDPLRPNFGSEVPYFIDKPMNEAQPRIVFAVSDAVERWEKRLKITKVQLIDENIDKRNIIISGIAVSSAAQVELKITI